MSRFCLYFCFTDEASAVAALPQCRVATDNGDAWSTDCIVTGTKDGTHTFTVSPDKPDGFYVYFLYEDIEGVLISTYEALPEWLMTASNGYAQWTPIRGDMTLVPDNAFA